MSGQAMSWAMSQYVQRSSAKFILVAMANYTDARMLCWVSAERLAKDTSQNIKTVELNISRLVESEHIVACQWRVGKTGRVRVYKFNTVKYPYRFEVDDSTELDEISHDCEEEIPPISGEFKENLIPPKTGSNTPKNGLKYPQKRIEIPPKTGVEYINESIKDKSLKVIKETRKNCAVKNKAKMDMHDLIAQGVEPQLARDWLIVRKEKGLALTESKWQDMCKQAEEVGLTPNDAVSYAVKSDWGSFKADWWRKREQSNGVVYGQSINKRAALEKSNMEVAARLLVKYEEEDRLKKLEEEMTFEG